MLHSTNPYVRGRLIRSKSTAYGRVTRRASSGPACILRVVIPGLGVMRAIQELPPPSDRESARRATGMASDCLTTTPPTGATSRRRPPRGAFLIPRPLAEEPHSSLANHASNCLLPTAYCLLPTTYCL